MSDYNASIEALNNISFSIEGLHKAYIEEHNRSVELIGELVELNAEFERYKKFYNAPVRAGDSVWSAYPFPDGKIREGGITVVMYDEDGFYGAWADFGPEPIAAEFVADDFGKTVFLTLDEAEAAQNE